MNAHAERLRGIVDALEVQDQLPRSRQFISDAADEIERLQAQVEELQKDKARIEFLFANPSCNPVIVGNGEYVVQKFLGHTIGRGITQREAIDKAMEQTK